MPHRWAFRTRSSWSAAPSSPASANPPVMTIAERTFLSPNWRMVAGTGFAGMMTPARSVPSGISPADRTEDRPRITSPFGFTGRPAPENPASRMFRKIWNPIFSWLEDSPITAMRPGRKRGVREEIIGAPLPAGPSPYRRNGDPWQDAQPSRGKAGRPDFGDNLTKGTRRVIPFRIRSADERERKSAAGRLPRGAFPCPPVLIPLDFPDVGRFLSFGSGGDLELHFHPFGEGAEAVSRNLAEMDENVFPFIRGDETVPFRIVEPFHRPCCHSSRSPLFFSPRWRTILPFPAAACNLDCLGFIRRRGMPPGSSSPRRAQGRIRTPDR